jgi:hypothetical protein
MAPLKLHLILGRDKTAFISLAGTRDTAARNIFVPLLNFLRPAEGNSRDKRDKKLSRQLVPRDTLNGTDGTLLLRSVPLVPVSVLVPRGLSNVLGGTR